MSRVTLRPEADADLLDIALYIGSDDPTASDRFIELIGDKLDLLAGHPEMGRARPELGPAVRSFPVGNYVVFYVPIADGIDVVRVLSGARDLGSAFE